MKKLLKNHRPKGLTQQELARVTGLTQCQISQIENGKECTLRNFVKYLEGCEKSLKVIKPYKKEV